MWWWWWRGGSPNLLENKVGEWLRRFCVFPSSGDSAGRADTLTRREAVRRESAGVKGEVIFHTAQSDSWLRLESPPPLTMAEVLTAACHFWHNAGISQSGGRDLSWPKYNLDTPTFAAFNTKIARLGALAGSEKVIFLLGWPHLFSDLQMFAFTPSHFCLFLHGWKCRWVTLKHKTLKLHEKKAKAAKSSPDSNFWKVSSSQMKHLQAIKKKAV